MADNKFAEKVFDAVRAIPKGKVASYSQIAAKAGSPNAYRAVGNILHSNDSSENAPCHRVVNNDGRLAAAYVFGGEGKQEEHLRAEGVAFKKDGGVDMRKSRHIF